MSAWYIFSSMGFYPVNPASGEYVIGSPLFDKVTIHAGSGEDFEIRVRNDNTEVDRYVQSVYLNRQLYPRSFIRHETRSEEHTSELQSLMRISYAVFCLKKKKKISRDRAIYNGAQIDKQSTQ